MSSPSVGNELSHGIGGADPLFYAQCQLFWAQRADLLQLSRNPAEQLRDNPGELPVIDNFMVAQREQILGHQGAGFNKPIGVVTTALSMASWDHAWIDPSNGGNNPEQRFSLFLRRKALFEDPDTGKHSITNDTELLVGTKAIICTELVTVGDEMRHSRISPGAKAKDVKDIRELFALARDAHANQRRLNEDTANKRLERLAALPGFEDVFGDDVIVHNTGNISVGGVSVNAAVRCVISRLPTFQLTRNSYPHRLYDRVMTSNGLPSFPPEAEPAKPRKQHLEELLADFRSAD